MGPTIVWFRRDLRLSDHPALHWAAGREGGVVPVYIHDPESEGPERPGAASRWWLHQSLTALSLDLARRGSRLVLRQGDTVAVLTELCREAGAAAVTWTRLYEPLRSAIDRRVDAALRELGVQVHETAGSLLFEPWQIATKQGEPYRVFTPYWKALQARREAIEPPLPAPADLTAPPVLERLRGLPLDALQLEPRSDWTVSLADAWDIGEAAAQRRFQEFRDAALAAYREGRERPADGGSSRLSPYLHFGEITPRQVWQGARDGLAEAGEDAHESIDAYLRELAWREFAGHVLWHFPDSVTAPLKREFAHFPWRDDYEERLAWQRGQTGYPLVDAGMRELWATGWMHNRARMVAGSFLVKQLLQPWQEGAKWFWDTLVDADLANNTLGWQWVAGSGADAAPYFRIFNPILQSQRHDPRGEYLRRWLPELRQLPDQWLHRPHEAPEDVLDAAGVTLGQTYPHPIVDLAAARERALAAYRER